MIIRSGRPQFTQPQPIEITIPISGTVRATAAEGKKRFNQIYEFYDKFFEGMDLNQKRFIIRSAILIICAASAPIAMALIDSSKPINPNPKPFGVPIW